MEHSTYEGAAVQDELITVEVEFHRFILPEINTHRCLSADTELRFDLPKGSRNSNKRVHRMTIKSFYDKWTNGVKEHVCGSTLALDLSKIQDDVIYSSRELSNIFGIASSNIDASCRKLECVTQNPNKKRGEPWKIKGSDFKAYRKGRGLRTFPLRNRLKKMKLRMLNTSNNVIEHTTITDVWEVGIKPVLLVELDNGFKIKATDDHPFLTTSGWVELKNLKVGDKVLTQGQGERKKDPIRLKRIGGRWVSKFNKEVLPVLCEAQQYKCHKCGKNKKLEVHHLVPVHVDQTKAFDIGNVIAVCNSCHNEYHAEQDWQEGNFLLGKEQEIVSISPGGEEVVYDLSVASDEHNFVANGFVVHNCLSRNYQSSRAVPVEKLIDQVQNNPAIPVHWGKNQRGMVAEQEIDFTIDWPFNDSYEGYRFLPKAYWEECANTVASLAEQMHKAGYHKQIVNRLLEPFMWTRGVITATRGAWESVFALRCHKDAQPEFQALAYKIREAINASTPQELKVGEWHLPYVLCDRNALNIYSRQEYFNSPASTAFEQYSLEEAIKISTSCCAQVSYRTLDDSLEKALKIYDMLNLPEGGKFKEAPAHMSPCEHQACVMGSAGNFFEGGFALNGNFGTTTQTKWAQHRKILEAGLEEHFIKQ